MMTLEERIEDLRRKVNELLDEDVYHFDRYHTDRTNINNFMKIYSGIFMPLDKNKDYEYKSLKSFVKRNLNRNIYFANKNLNKNYVDLNNQNDVNEIIKTLNDLKEDTYAYDAFKDLSNRLGLSETNTLCILMSLCHGLELSKVEEYKLNTANQYGLRYGQKSTKVA